MKIKKLLALSILTTLVLTSCGVSNTPVVENSQTINIVYNKDSIKQSALNAIQTGEKDSSFTEDFSFDSSDISSIDDSYRDYYFEGAYYIQTGTYMYRFQLNEQSLIESYIKYNLEA